MSRPIDASFSESTLRDIKTIKDLTDKSFSTVARKIMDKGIEAIKKMSADDFNELMKGRS